MPVPIKLDMSARQAAAILEGVWGPGIESVVPVAQGEISRAFFFTRQGRSYVIRFNASPAPFALDRYAAESFANHVPTARVCKTGLCDGIHYAISVRLKGEALQTMSWPWATSVRATLVATLGALRHIDISARCGYGPVASDGVGLYPSWQDYLEGLFSDQETGFWEGWRDLFSTSFLELDLFQVAHERMARLIPLCPAERAVVHGDFHVGNILSDGQAVTGLVDWGNLKYGDPLYDLAVFHFWTPAVDLPAAYAAGVSTPQPHRRERLLCYTLCVALDALRFYAKAGREDAYMHIRQRVLAVIGEQ